MKKKMIIIIAAVVLIAVLFIPIPKAPYDDGGTREYVALTYKIVDWNKIDGGEVYQKTRIYFGSTRKKNITELWEHEVNLRSREQSLGGAVDEKPVIYLYPEKETNVSVYLDLNGELTCSYPEYNGGWQVTATPDGTLTDERGQVYNYLYWEGENQRKNDFSKGFCVKGEDTAEFLEEVLAKQGLTRKEANEFIVYWLPAMEQNPYNVISFQNENYTDSAKLNVSPAPDTVIRVFMAWYGSAEPVEIAKQVFKTPERSGFTVVEWGGQRDAAPNLSY